ncbi:hypothetical protein B296_00030756 [Ensete ventricosum]|uniref:Prohibitin n=1 Tax=Ensete ventricosum TaxID=4639 RepID=A0A427AI44_ENSVE|nr:hypothetical protein B296_00030756 [Ensete ventricosum]
MCSRCTMSTTDLTRIKMKRAMEGIRVGLSSSGSDGRVREDDRTGLIICFFLRRVNRRRGMAGHAILMARASIIRLVHCPNVSTSDIDAIADLSIPLLCFFPVIVKQAALNHDLYLPHINWRCLSSSGFWPPSKVIFLLSRRYLRVLKRKPVIALPKVFSFVSIKFEDEGQVRLKNKKDKSFEASTDTTTIGKETKEVKTTVEQSDHSGLPRWRKHIGRLLHQGIWKRSNEASTSHFGFEGILREKRSVVRKVEVVGGGAAAMNFKKVKGPSVPSAVGTLVKVALIGGTAVYAALNSLYNVDGGHRAIVFNRIVGIKDKVPTHDRRYRNFLLTGDLQNLFLLVLAVCWQLYQLAALRFTSFWTQDFCMVIPELCRSDMH